MAQPTIDPTFYRSAADAAAARGEELAYVVAFDRAAKKHDAMTVIDVDLSVDDRFLYVSCWGTGELKQFDVSDPAYPEQVGSVRLGGILLATGGGRIRRCHGACGRSCDRER